MGFAGQGVDESGMDDKAEFLGHPHRLAALRYRLSLLQQFHHVFGGGFQAKEDRIGSWRRGARAKARDRRYRPAPERRSGFLVETQPADSLDQFIHPVFVDDENCRHKNRCAAARTFR